MDEGMLAELASALRTWRTQECITLGVVVAVLYYYLTTTNEEVEHIWPQPILRLGKILFYTQRLCVISYFVVRLLVEFPHHIEVSTQACNRLSQASNVFSSTAATAAEAIFWMCLYALIGARRRYFVLLAILFVAFLVPIQALKAIDSASTSTWAVERSPLDLELGYPCTWNWMTESLETPGYGGAARAARYLALARTSVTASIAVVAFFVTYRRQRNRLLRVIQREGGIYHFGMVALYTFLLVEQATDTKIKDPYSISGSLSLLRFVFADRLLLLLNTSQDPGTQEFVRSIIFAHSTNISELEEDCRHEKEHFDGSDGGKGQGRD